MREPATTERGHLGQEALSQSAAFSDGPMLFQQQVAETLFEGIDGFQRRPFSQIDRQPLLLLSREMVPMTTHQRKQSAMLGSEWINLLPAGQEVMVNRTHHMEAIGHNLGLGKVFAHQSPITGGQIHAD